MQHTLKVTGLSCNHCRVSIQTAVKQTGATASIDITRGIVIVEYDPAKISLALIKQSITNLGYGAE